MKINIPLTLLAILCLSGMYIVCAVVISQDHFYANAYDSACDKIGMKNYEAQDSTFCVDNKGNANYVMIECDGEPSPFKSPDEIASPS